MTLTVVNTYQTTPAGNGTDGGTLLVTGTGTIAFDGDVAVFMSGANQRTTIYGEVFSSSGRAILSQGDNAQVYVAEGANVSGTTGIQTGTNAYVQNAGTVDGHVSLQSGRVENTGTIFDGLNTFFGGSVTNYGEILGLTQVETRDLQQNFSVYNSGHMQSFDSRAFTTDFENVGLVDDFYCQNFLTLTNSGTISSLRFDDAGGKVVNHGLIDGDRTDLSEGDDFLDSRQGTLSGQVLANDGNDTVYGSVDDNILDGGNGDDKLDGYLGADTMVGGAGDDIYIVDNTEDIVDEGFSTGADIIHSTISFDLSDTDHVVGAIEKLVLLGTADLNATGSTRSETIVGNLGDNLVRGEDGNDRLYGGAGDDRLVGSTGADRLFGQSGEDVLIGGADDDLLDGGTGGDTMYGGAGDDTYVVDDIDDVVSEALTGSNGSDLVQSTIDFKLSDTTQVKGAVEDLTLLGSDSLFGIGNALDNTIVGNSGVNTIDGGVGNDVLTGGGGADKFRFSSALAGNTDTVKDFVHNSDKIVLDSAIFTQLAAGNLSATNFAINAPGDANDFIVYNTTTGVLSYDSNGSGAGGSTNFAKLSGVPGITQGDFVIV